MKTFEPKLLYKNKHIQPQRKFRRSYKKSVYITTIGKFVTLLLDLINLLTGTFSTNKIEDPTC